MEEIASGLRPLAMTVIAAGLALLCLGACAPAAVPAAPAPPAAATAQPAPDEAAIRQLILSEGDAVARRDLAALMDLWAPDAVVTDAKHTPDDPGDDARWRGRYDIRSRYVVMVFPGNPQAAGAAEITITAEGDEAVATAGGDRWTFARREGRWWITGLTYNLKPL